MELPLRKDILSGWIQRHPLVNMRFLVFLGTFEQAVKSEGGLKKYKPKLGGVSDPSGKTLTQMIAESGFGPQDLPLITQVYGTGVFPSTPQLGDTGSIGGLGGFGLSNIRVGMSGEVERARLDILERMKRTTDSRAKSRLTLPKLFGDDKKEKNILADVL